MDETIKYKIVERIIQTQDETLLKEIKNLVGLSDEDFCDELNESTIISIKQGIKDAENGKTRSHEEVMSELRSRFLK